jgi:opacity protein-like surface antigen
MNQDIENKGWDSMQKILAKEMPRSRRNSALIWTLAFLIFVPAAGFLGYIAGQRQGEQVFPAEILHSTDSGQFNQENKDTENILPTEPATFMGKQASFEPDRSVAPLANNQGGSGKANIGVIEPVFTAADATNMEKNNTLATTKGAASSVPDLWENGHALEPSDRNESLSESPANNHQDAFSKINAAVEENPESQSAISEPVQETALQTIASQTVSVTQSKPFSFWIGAGSGVQSYALQDLSLMPSAGVDYKIGRQWSVFAQLGMTYRMMQEEYRQVLLPSGSGVLQRTYSAGSIALNGKYNVAELNYRSMVSGFAGLGLRYQLSKNLTVFSALQYQRIFGHSINPVRHLDTYADGSPNAEILYPEEILTNYPLFRLADFNLQGGVAWHLGARWTLDGFLNYGLHPLLYNTLSQRNGRNQLIGIQLRYIL